MVARQQLVTWPVWRWIAPALAVGLGVVPLVEVVHTSGQAHAVCIEHGEFVHVEPRPGEGRSRADAPRLDVAPAARRGHHHCRLLAQARPRAVTPEDRPGITAPAPAITRSTHASDRISTIHAPLHYAPKTSPPAPLAFRS
jgi:hypothetical protein